MEVLVSKYKWWREDKYLWEEKIILFWVIPYYKYSIFKNGKLKKHIKLFKYSKPLYLKGSVKTNVYVGKKEFETVYNSNKWLVPTNYELNLEVE